MMERNQCFKLLAEHRGEAIVVATYSSAFEWMRVSPSPRNFWSVGAMGQASSHGLGLALGLPGHKIIVIDGDGALLMNLSSLVTIAQAAPGNLVHFVAENGCYEANGSHPIPGQGRVSFAGMARAAGYAHVFEFDGLNHMAAELATVLTLPGPVFATLRITATDEPPQDYEYIHSAQVRAEFRAAIQPLLAK